MRKGVLITVYGINTIGKTTHSKLLVENLIKDGYDAKYVKYPVYEISPSGPFINKSLRESNGQLLSEDELQLWFVLNRYQFQPTLKKWLEEGKIIIAEDYTGTGIAWGMTKGLEEDWITSVNRHLLKEDFTVLFEGERANASIEKNHVHEQNTEYMNNCEKILSSLGDKYNWKRLKVREKIPDTQQAFRIIIDEYLKQRYI